MKKSKKLVSLLLTICMLLSVVPMMCITASAENSTYGSDITFNQVLSSAGGTLSAGNYYLSGDTTLTNGITIAGGATVNLNLAGNVLCGNGSTTVIKVYDNATLNIYDYYTGTTKTHKFVVPDGKTGLWTWNDSSGTETVTGGCITGGNGSLESNDCYYGGGIWGTEYTTVNLYAGTICGNQCGLSANQTGYGGGVYMTQNSSFTMYGGAVCGNKASGIGGGILANETKCLTIKKGCRIAYNEAGDGGGGIDSIRTNLTITGAEISYNKATDSTSDGGGLRIVTSSSVSAQLNECTIIGNEAPRGAAIYVFVVYTVDTATVQINGGTITGNITTSTTSGCIHTYGEVGLELSGKVIVSGNKLGDANSNLEGNVLIGYPITVGSDGLYYGSVIGVTTIYNNRFFMNGGLLSEATLNRYAYYFQSDISDYGAQYINDGTYYGLRMAEGVTPTDPGDDGTGGGILTFTALENNSRICLRKYNSPAAISLSYSLDGGSTWNSYTVNNFITLQKDATIAFKGENSTFSTAQNAYYCFYMSTGSFSAAGSVTSLLDGVGTDAEIQLPDYCFCGLFRSCARLTQAPELISTNLGAYCYSGMFAQCTGITETPELPATTLKNYCYTSMFYGCTGLTAPADMSHVTTLASNCCGGMYSGCSNIILNTSKIYDDDTEWTTPNITNVYGWCNSMFTNTSGSANSGVVLNKTYYIHVPKVSAVTNGTPEANKATNNGYISSLVTEAKDGATVTVTTTPNTGYVLDKITVYKTGTPATTVSVSNNQFTMPAYAVTVTATFKADTKYTVSKADCTNGSFEVDTTSCAAGTTVNVTSTPDTGYKLDKVTYYKTSDSSNVTTVSNNQFTMPAYDVTVCVSFKLPDYKCKIKDGSSYETISAAISAVGNNETTIILLDNVTENVTVSSGQNITLDLDGYVLKSAANEKPVILNSGTLTVKSTNTERNHYFTAGNNKLWTWNGDSAVTDYIVTGGVVTGGYSEAYDDANLGCGIRTTSTLTLDHINIVGNSNRWGGGIRCSAGCTGTIKISDSTIVHNYSNGGGAGISFNSTAATYAMERCDVSDNYCAGNAGGIVVLGTLTMTDCTVSDNYATGVAGGIRMYNSGANVTINGGTITGNTSVDIGGGVYYENAGSVTLGGNVVITGNTGESKTENLYLPSDKTASVSNPGADMNVGVTLANGTGNVTGANGTDYSMYFSSDNTSYTVKNDSNTVKLVSTSDISADVSGAGYSASLTLNKNIDINFKITNISVEDESKLVIYVDGKIWDDYEISTEGVLSGVLSKVEPKDIGTALHIVVTYDNVQVKNFNYSVKSYCEAVFAAYAKDNSTYEKLNALCEALLNYGKYAEDYVNGNTASTVNEGHEATFDSYTFTGLKDAKVTLGDYVNEGSAAYLTLGSTIKLNFILKGCTDLSTGYDENGNVDKNNPQNFFVVNDKDTPEQIDPKRVKVTTSGTDTIVSIDLYASQLSTSYTLKLKGVETSKFCITYGVYNYCCAAQSQTDAAFTDTVKTLCKAIHNYSVAVDAYIASTK